MSDIIITFVTTLAMTAGLSFMVSLIKKGQFENWGIKVGKLLSRLGDAKLGRNKWEKIEDALLIAFVSFAQGVKKGADLDDNRPDTEIITQIEHGSQRIKRQLKPGSKEPVL